MATLEFGASLDYKRPCLPKRKRSQASSPLLCWWVLDLLKTFISLDGSLNAGPKSDAWGFLDAWINLLSVKSKLVSQSEPDR